MTMTTLGLYISLAFFQVVFGPGVTIGAGVTAGAPQAQVNLPASCGTVAQAAWDEAELQWLPFEVSAANSDVGDGCAAASVIPEDMSF